MKFAVNIMLFVFVLFLSTPTIVSVIQKSTDTSIFFSMAEEELSHKEVAAEFKNSNSSNLFHFSDLTSSLIHSENLSKHDNVSSTIFIPPPELA